VASLAGSMIAEIILALFFLLACFVSFYFILGWMA
jgi:hypothetical protein